MKLKWDEDAWNDYLYWQTQDKKTLKRINSILKDKQRRKRWLPHVKTEHHDAEEG